jgi:uncharacterized protein (DUF1778 family)
VAVPRGGDRRGAIAHHGHAIPNRLIRHAAETAPRTLTDFVVGAAVEPKTTTKALALRLPVEQAEALKAIAGVDEVSINEEIRRAIAAHRGSLSGRGVSRTPAREHRAK